jgi:type IV pilus assembly protein PilN
MIRVNLLAAERKVARKKLPSFQATGQKITVACSLILVGAALLVGWRYWSLTQQSARLDAEIASAQQETTRLRSIITQVQQFEQRKAQLQQRVALIEQLRKAQTGPVHMLDQISRAMPPALWLTALRQGAAPDEVLIEGRSTTQTGVSDFAANLEASGYFKRSVDIVSTQTETITQAPGELVRFSLRAIFQQPAAATPPAPVPPVTSAGG